MGQWTVDNNGYYSDVNARYVTYHDESPGYFFNDAKRALINGLAIARILNRTLIIPKFRCLRGSQGFCPLNSFIMIKQFDTCFHYRESEFLNHPLVPANIRKPEAVYHISEETTAGWHQVDYRQILNVMGKIDFPVLHIDGPLTNMTVTLKDDDEQTHFYNCATNGFKRANYRQFSWSWSFVVHLRYYTHWWDGYVIFTITSNIMGQIMGQQVIWQGDSV